MSATAETVPEETRADARGPRRWWRRNALWLVAVAVLVPATAGSIALHEFTEQVESTQWRETQVQGGDQIELGGTTMGPARIDELPTFVGIEQPSGTRLVAVRLQLSPGAEPFSCLAPLLIERGTGREWKPAYAPISWEGETSCSEVTAPVELRLPYIVPADAGPFELEVVSAGIGDERLPRFVLESH